MWLLRMYTHVCTICMQWSNVGLISSRHTSQRTFTISHVYNILKKDNIFVSDSSGVSEYTHIHTYIRTWVNIYLFGYFPKSEHDDRVCEDDKRSSLMNWCTKCNPVFESIKWNINQPPTHPPTHSARPVRRWGKGTLPISC